MKITKFLEIVNMLNTNPSKKKEEESEVDSEIDIKFSINGKLFDPSLFCLNQSNNIVVLLKDTKEKLEP